MDYSKVTNDQVERFLEFVAEVLNWDDYDDLNKEKLKTSFDDFLQWEWQKEQQMDFDTFIERIEQGK